MFKSKNIKITDFTLKSKQPFFKAQSISGKFQRRFTGIHFYEAEFTANFMAQDINEVKEFVARHLFVVLLVCHCLTFQNIQVMYARWLRLLLVLLAVGVR
ncbi:hypothetical protein [Escherichia coli]|uniref:hypothetical protein n=1 Tax=Escherichia coli TaxID=562 RepID=UPI0020CE8E63|nr:hypothetical protein [Escherichia coli]